MFAAAALEEVSFSTWYQVKLDQGRVPSVLKPQQEIPKTMLSHGHQQQEHVSQLVAYMVVRQSLRAMCYKRCARKCILLLVKK